MTDDRKDEPDNFDKQSKEGKSSKMFKTSSPPAKYSPRHSGSAPNSLRKSGYEV